MQILIYFVNIDLLIITNISFNVIFAINQNFIRRMFDPHSLDPSDKTSLDVKRRNVPSSILTLTGFPSTVLGIMPFDRLALQYVPLITWYVKTSETKRITKCNTVLYTFCCLASAVFFFKY